jgi:hypothetical protein
MAVNTQKFLPSSKSVSLAKVSQNIAKGSSSLGITESAQKNISIISIKVIEIDKILKGTLASQKKQLDNQKRQQSSQRREKQEEKLETKPDAEKGKIKMPKVPRLGIFDWIKNFIGNVILGYFAVRLIDHLPKIIPIVKFIGKATDLVLDIGGKLLDGLVTFIDIGYKAVDFSRGLVGKTFGDEALKNLDKLTSEFEKFMNLAIIVGMASADFGMDRLRDIGTKKATEKGAGTLARRGAGKVATRTAARVGGKGAAKLTAKVGSKALKAVPFLGAGLAIVEGIMRIKDGDYVGGLLSFGTAIPVAGWAFLALDIAREFMGGQEFDKSVGKAFGGKPGLTDKQVQKRTPHMSGPSFMGLAGGGVTRGGKKQTSVKRTISKGGRKGKYKRTIARKPGEVQISSPGADVGGEDKLFGVFPNPFKKVVDTFNPFKNAADAGKNLGKSDYFGPILAITSKILLGQKPNQKDYENVGLGINLLISKGIDAGKLKGGIVAAFAEGGLVDPKALEAISEGGDISKWVSDTFKQSTETNAQKTLREIQQNLKLKKDQEQKKKEEIVPTDGMEDAALSESEMDLFQRLVLAESGGQGKVGMALVARSVLNRAGLIQSGKATTGTFAAKDKTVNGVIMGRGQYQPITDGSINRRRTPQQMGAAKEAIKLSQNPDKLRVALKSEGIDDGSINKLLAATGFRTGSAFSDPSQNVNVVRYKDHYFNTAGNKALIVASSQVSERVTSVPLAGGDGRFIQGNSGRSGGTHFHIGTNEPGDGSGVAASGFRVIKNFLGKKSIFVGRSGETIPVNATDEQIRGYISRGQSAHRQTELDLQIGGTGEGNKVAFPLALKNMRYSATDGYGVSADVVGTNAFVGHGRYKPDGSLAPQQKLVLNSGAPDFYAFHGMHKVMSKDGILKFHKGEFVSVTDADSFRLVGNILMDINSIENKSQLIAKAPSIIERIKAISGYTDYEMPSPEVVYIPVPISNDTPEDYSSQSSGGLAMFAGGEADNPFKTLYQGT